MPIAELLKKTSEQFGQEQLKKFKTDPRTFDQHVRMLIDNEAPEFKACIRLFADQFLEMGGPLVQTGFLAGILIGITLLANIEAE